MVANCKASIDNERYPIGHFRVALSLCSKVRQSENLLISKWLFILMQVKLIFKRKVLHHCRHKKVAKYGWNCMRERERCIKENIAQ